MFALALEVIHALEESGFEAFIVGGAVRDMLLDREPGDYDLVTTAPPDLVLDIAVLKGWQAKKIGKAFGVIVLLIRGRPLEVATARTEWYGADSHRPEGIRFSSCIKTDLARRDFTINAMAMGADGHIIDPYGGRKDLADGVIRTVGDAATRFSEDALRLFRAIRFVSQFGFDLDVQLLKAIPGCLYRVKGLALERIRDELEKILLAPFTRKGLDLLVSTGLAGASCRYRKNGTERNVQILPELELLRNLSSNICLDCFKLWEHTLSFVSAVPPELTLRWAALLYDLGQGIAASRGIRECNKFLDCNYDEIGVQAAARILSRLRFPISRRKKIIWLIKNHRDVLPYNKQALIRWLKKRSLSFDSQAALKETLARLVLLRYADLATGVINPSSENFQRVGQLLDEVLATVPFYAGELAINGHDVVLKLGGGPQVGRFLAAVLEKVIEGHLPNNREVLLDVLVQEAQKQKKKP